MLLQEREWSHSKAQDSPGTNPNKSNKVNSALRLWARVLARRRRLVTASAIGILVVLAALFMLVSYDRYARLIDARLKNGPFHDSVNIYAAALALSTGDQMTQEDLIAALRTAGYAEASSSRAGLGMNSWRILPDAVEVSTNRSASPVTVYFANNQISRLLIGGREVKVAQLGAPLMTTLSARDAKDPGKGHRGEERLLVSYAQIPPVLVHAVVSAEDKRFFRHRGLDVLRILKAAYVDTRDHKKEQGASTLTMQLVRSLWLAPDKLWMRKVAEAMMTLHLEREWSKERIFETYVNQVYLGRRASYSVHGFGQGARLYFGKSLHDIDLPEAALLAGLVQRPSYFNPFRYPERAKERRDLVLRLMLENKYITADQYRAALIVPIQLANGSFNQTRAPYFLDLVDSELQNSDDEPIRSVYTTVDLNLQRAAEEAIRTGMQEVDKALARRKGASGAHAQAALIAIDPHTGEIRALVGGRDYERSQLNRVLSMRPPGSVFKPFVYAAALNTALSGGENVYTPATTVDDTPMTFWFKGKPYEPGNFEGEAFGTLTLRQALAKSDNVAAVKVAQGVGFGAVVKMARRAGLNASIEATPAVALGAYDVTPLEMAGAYTVFANGGVWVQPRAIVSYRDGAGRVLSSSAPVTHQALDPRVTWLMVSMLEEVIRSGTAAGVRARGFALPAAGKTGTSHDGWFAGFTSQLLCIVWVGYDDYRELNLEGAKSALPIWTEFMRRAAHIGAWGNAKEFPMPHGIEQARICEDTGAPACDCDNARTEYFIAGSEPSECDIGQSVPIAANAAAQ
jgi:penicillin-binding protein 1B